MTDKELSNIKLYGHPKPNKFNILSKSIIVGVIERNDVARSKQFNYGVDLATHERLYPLIYDRRWRWSLEKGIIFSVYGPDTGAPVDKEIIRNHLRREYGIRFLENGSHDSKYFLSKIV